MTNMVKNIIFAAALYGCACLFAIASPASAPEDSVVFIEVSREDLDPETGATKRTKIAEGSGFVVNNQGWIVTALHVVDISMPATSRLVIEGALKSRHASKLPLEKMPGSVSGIDAALLRFPPGLSSDFPYLCYLVYPELKTGQKIVAYGFPLGLDLFVRPGSITSLTGAGGAVQTNSGVVQGMSGGPILSEDGKVIGIVSKGIVGHVGYDNFTPMNMAAGLLKMVPPPNSSCYDAASSSSVIERSYQIDETNDTHSGASSSSKSYRITKKADPGYKIVDARLVRQSDTRVSDLNINVSEDRKSADLSFKLTAGPIFDQYRGWLHGQLILTMKPE